VAAKLTLNESLWDLLKGSFNFLELFTKNKIKDHRTKHTKLYAKK
jgi:hypothetical protein